MAGFTSGKWEFSNSDVSKNMLQIWTTPEGESMPLKIASIHNNSRIGIRTAKANANLIAHAPEMYETLRFLIPHLKAFNETRVVSEVEELLARVAGEEA